MMIAPSWQVHEIVALNAKLDFSVHPVPQLTSQLRIAWSSAWVEGVSRNSKIKTSLGIFEIFILTGIFANFIYGGGQGPTFRRNLPPP